MERYDLCLRYDLWRFVKFPFGWVFAEHDTSCYTFYTVLDLKEYNEMLCVKYKQNLNAMSSCARASVCVCVCVCVCAWRIDTPDV